MISIKTPPPNPPLYCYNLNVKSTYYIMNVEKKKLYWSTVWTQNSLHNSLHMKEENIVIA